MAITHVSLLMIWFFCLHTGYCDKYITCAHAGLASSDCQVEVIDSTPWSTVETPAPRPTVDVFSWFIERSEHNCSSSQLCCNAELAINVTWHQAGSELKELVDGYYIYLNELDHKFDLKLLVNLKQSFKEKLDMHEKVVFYYIFDGGLKPGYYVIMIVHALPMYQYRTRNQGVTKQLHVPECEATDKNVFRPETTTPSYIGSTISTLHNPIMWIAIAIIAAAGLLVIYAAKNKGLGLLNQQCTNKKNETEQGEKGILVLVGTNGIESSSAHCKGAFALADFLKQHSGKPVACNLWHMQEIDNPIEWTHNQMKKSTDIVLFCTPWGKINYEKHCSDGHSDVVDPFVVGIRGCIKNEREKLLTRGKNFFVVHFDDEVSVSIPEALTSFNFTFQVQEDAKKLLTKLDARSGMQFKCSSLMSTLQRLQRADDNADTGSAEGETLLPGPIDEVCESTYLGQSYISSCEGSCCTCDNDNISSVNSFQASSFSL